MSRRVPFELEIDGATVRGHLDLPTPRPGGRRWPTVLVCRGMHTFEDEAADLLQQAAETFVKARLAVADFEPRSATMIMEDFDAYTAADNVEDAAAVLAWLREHDEVDPDAIGVLGYDLGGITAACLGRRQEHLGRVALLAPAAPGVPASTNAGDNGTPTSSLPELPAGYAESLAQLKPAADLAFHARPTLLMHGAADRTTPPEASLGYRNALVGASRRFDHLLIARADHLLTAEDTRLAGLHHLTQFFREMESRPDGDDG